MELRAEHEGVLRFRQLGDLHEDAVRRGARENEAVRFEMLHIRRRALVALQ